MKRNPIANVAAVLLVAGCVFGFVKFAQALPTFLGLNDAESYAVTCGGGVQDGGYNLADAGATVDGGYPITQLTESGRAAFAAAGVSQVVANNSANLVYVGDAEVQPDDGFPICSTAGSCSHQALPADFTEGALYCTGTAAQGVRVLVGKPRP